MRVCVGLDFVKRILTHHFIIELVYIYIRKLSPKCVRTLSGRSIVQYTTRVVNIRDKKINLVRLMQRWINCKVTNAETKPTNKCTNTHVCTLCNAAHTTRYAEQLKGINILVLGKSNDFVMEYWSRGSVLAYISISLLSIVCRSSASYISVALAKRNIWHYQHALGWSNEKNVASSWWSSIHH